MKPTDQYALVAPATKTGKHLVCSRRIGTKDRLAPIAECRSEAIAAQIIDGLNLRQKAEVTINAALELLVNDLKAQVARAREAENAAKFDSGRMRTELRELSDKITRLTHERNITQHSLEMAQKDIATLSEKVEKARLEGANV